MNLVQRQEDRDAVDGLMQGSRDSHRDQWD
ncbi:MAG: hypothetical protein Ct9H300mP23_07560 [Nitrospinota bacterium]|nr:MAG: hypothetical protein Ct9H300mP23_07560 [Nitrospinota bacterium]